MKKVIALILSFSLLVASSTTASAQEISADGQFTVPIIFEKRGSYTVNIPASIDISNGNVYYFTAKEVSITEDSVVSIYPPERVDFTQTNGEPGRMSISLANTLDDPSEWRVAYFENGMLTSPIGMLTKSGLTEVSSWAGEATFTIKLEKKSDANK